MCEHCEAHNLRLDDDLTCLTTFHSVLESEFFRLQAENLQLCIGTKPTSDQERATLIGCAGHCWYC